MSKFGGVSDFAEANIIVQDEIPSVAKTSNSLIRLTRLSGLEQAVFILYYINEGRSTNEIVKSCDDDAQLVDIWIEFMAELKWLERKGSDGSGGANESIIVTARGKEAVKKHLNSKLQKNQYSRAA